MLKILSGEILSLPTGAERSRLYSKFPQIIFIIEGNIFISKIRTEIGEGYFIPENTELTMKADRSAPCSAVRFLLDGKDTETLLSDRALDGGEPVRFVLRERDSSVALIRALCVSLDANPSDTFAQAAAKLAISLIRAEDTSAYSPVYANAYVDRAVRYIDENLSTELRVERIAEHLGVDRMYLRNLFAEHVGTSTMDYIMNARITKAKELLTDERLSVASVANAVGYKDALAFSKVFKKYTGMTPKRYITDIKMVHAEHYLISTEYPIQKISEIVGYNNYTNFYIAFKNKYGIAPEEYRKAYSDSDA